jgi:two-component system LytT family response regulator
MKTSCIIVDDDPLALTLLARYISKTSALLLIATFKNATEALVFLEGRRVDIVFTDIDMPGMSGLDFAAALPLAQQIIFVTRSDNYAFHSFRYWVIDYVLKPVSYERFCLAVAKIQVGVGGRLKKADTGTDHFFAKKRGELVRINFKDILYIKGEKEYVSLHFKDGRLLIYKRMKDMENILSSNFIRVHSSYIISIEHIAKVVANKFVIIGETQIPIGATYRSNFEKHIS